MADHESTMKWKVDISELTKAMQEARRSIKVANAEFKTATAGMDKWGKSADGIEAKIKQLNAVLPKQKTILAQLEKQYELTAQHMGENSKEAQDLKVKLENQRATIVKTETSISKYTSKLSDMQSASGKLNSSIDEQQRHLDGLKRKYADVVLEYGKNSKEARTLAKEISTLSSDLNKNKTSLQDAESAADKFDRTLADTGDTAKKAVEGFTVLKGALAVLVADGFRRAINEVKDFAKTMISEAATVKAEQSQFEQTFGDMGGEAEAAIKRVADSSGILDTRLKTVGAQIYAFARSSGASVPEAMELMETGLQAAADSAAYYDKSLEESSETLKSFLKGNFANDAALGVSATEFTRNAKATELFGKKYNELSEIQKQETLLKMVTDSQKLSGAMGQAAREADGWENVQGNLNETWRQFKASVGTPFLEALIPVIKDITEGFQAWQEEVDWNKFKKSVGDAADSVKDGFEWTIKNGDDIVDIFKNIAIAFITYKAVSTITSVGKAVKLLYLEIRTGTKAMEAFNGAMKANPIGLFAAGLAGLITLYKHLSEKQQEAVKEQAALSTSQQEAIDKVQEMADTYKQLDETRSQSVANITAEYSYIDKLKDEYNSLIDANGNVKKGYEDRANFILNVLANTLGVEVDQVEELISANGRLEDSIDSLIEKKKAEALLSANQDLYTEAIQKQKSAVEDLAKAHEAVEGAKEKYEESSKAWQTYAELLDEAPLKADEFYRANKTLMQSNDEAKKSYEEAQKSYEDAEEALVGYNSTIENYEGLAAAILGGDAAKIEEAMQNVTNSFITAETGTRESLERQLDNYEANVEALKKAIEDGTPGVTEEMLLQAESMVEAAKEELDKLPPEAADKGEEAGLEYSKNLGGTSGDAKREGGKVKSSAAGGMTSSGEFGEKGSSAGGEYGEGIGSKEDDVGTAAAGLRKTAERNLNDFDTYTSGSNFGRGFYNGISDWSESVAGAAYSMAQRAVANLKAGQQEGSPSKLTFRSGVFFGQGYEKGIASMASAVRKRATEMAQIAAGALKIDVTEKMRMAGVNGGRSFAEGLKETMPDLSAKIAGNLDGLKQRVAASSQGLKMDVGSFAAVGVPQGKQQIVNFNQTINSPKALNRLAVYRETNSLLFSAKVRLNNV